MTQDTATHQGETAVINSSTPVKNGSRQPSNINGQAEHEGAKRTRAYEQLRPILGKYKDDPRVLEVWDEIVASRHKDRDENNAGG